MKRYRQFQPVLISDFETDQWRHPVHNHNHYELIYIKKGSGFHHINQERISYKPGNVFLLGPEEVHYFEIGRRTRFIFLKFTDLHQEESKEHYWSQQFGYLIKNREARLSRFTLDPNDQLTVDRLFNVISTLKTDVRRNEQLIKLQALAISAILKRNLPEAVSGLQQKRDMERVFSYIHEHIYMPDKLRATAMAGYFNTTAGYIGPYFKRNTGITLRDYIQDYRKTLIKKRIESGHYSLKKIANEFGLTDESHVSKLLK